MYKLTQYLLEISCGKRVPVSSAREPKRERKRLQFQSNWK